MLAAGGIGLLILVVVLVAGLFNGPTVGSVGEAESAISNRFNASDVVCREDGERFDCDVTTYDRNGQVLCDGGMLIQSDEDAASKFVVRQYYGGWGGPTLLCVPDG